MAGTYSQNDTQVFAKSCVSFYGIDMSIHKSLASADYTADRIGKNVYEKQRTDDSYTAGLCSVRSKPEAFAQGASHLLHDKPIALTERGCCSAPGAPALRLRPFPMPHKVAVERRDRLADTVSAKERERECTEDV